MRSLRESNGDSLPLARLETIFTERAPVRNASVPREMVRTIPPAASQ